MDRRVGVKELARSEDALTGHYRFTSPALGRHRGTHARTWGWETVMKRKRRWSRGAGALPLPYELRPMAGVDIEVESRRRRRLSTSSFEVRRRASRFDVEFRGSTSSLEIRWRVSRFDRRAGCKIGGPN